VETSASAVKTSTSTGVSASTTAAVTTAMLSEGGCGAANKGQGYDSGNEGLQQGGLFHS
jgi:hypothetical protein